MLIYLILSPYSPNSFDRDLGGLEITMRLRDHLARLFNEQKKTDSNVFENQRSMAKLLKEAGRVKQVLSANTEHHAQVFLSFFSRTL